ncbi:conserved membrane hypothetical protein [Gammaproteobacteria bacterium]
MSIILKLFINILLLQAGPQDVPSSRFLLQVSLLLYFLAGILVSLTNFPPLPSVGISVVDTFLLVSLVWITLRVWRFEHRIAQTLTAVLGALGLLTVVALPLNAWYAALEHADQNIDQLPFLVMLGLLVWSLTVLSHILRHALDTSPTLATGLSLFYLVLSFTLTSILFVPTDME